MYEPSAELEKLAYKVIDDNEILKPIAEAGVNILFLWSSKQKKKHGGYVYADTERMKEKLRDIMPYDFVITFYKPNCEGMTENQMCILMLHELMHIGIDDDRLYVRPHNIEDFKEIVKAYGEDWAKH